MGYYRRNNKDLFSKQLKIKICENYQDVLKKDEEYYTNINLIKKVNDTVWITINQENQDKMMKHLENIYGKNLTKEELEYNYSSADDRNISDSNFGCSEDEDLILNSFEKIQISIFIKLYYNIISF